MGFSLTVSGSSGSVYFGKEVITSVRVDVRTPDNSLSKSNTAVAIVRITGKIIPGGAGGLLGAAGLGGGIGGLLNEAASLGGAGSLLSAAGADKAGGLLSEAAALGNAGKLLTGASGQGSAGSLLSGAAGQSSANSLLSSAAELNSANSLIHSAAAGQSQNALYQQIMQQESLIKTGSNLDGLTQNGMNSGAMGADGSQTDGDGDPSGGAANSGSTLQLFLWSLVSAKTAEAYRKVEVQMEGAGETFRTIVLPSAFVLDYSESYHHVTGNGKFNLLIQQRADQKNQVTVS